MCLDVRAYRARNSISRRAKGTCTMTAKETTRRTVVTTAPGMARKKRDKSDISRFCASMAVGCGVGGREMCGYAMGGFVVCMSVRCVGMQWVGLWCRVYVWVGCRVYGWADVGYMGGFTSHTTSSGSGATVTVRRRPLNSMRLGYRQCTKSTLAHRGRGGG